MRFSTYLKSMFTLNQTWEKHAFYYILFDPHKSFDYVT